MSRSTKHASLVIEIDELLRKRWSGSRFVVDCQELAHELRTTTQSVSVAAEVLIRIEGSGLKRSKGSKSYEFMMPAFYPGELQTMKESLRRDNDSQVAPPRGQMVRRLVGWLDELPEGDVFHYTDPAGELGYSATAVGSLLVEMSNTPGDRVEVYHTRGTYRKLSGRPPAPPLEPESNGSEPPSEPELDRRGVPKGPSPLTLSQAVEKRWRELLDQKGQALYEEVGTTGSGKVLIRNLGTGQVYLREELL